MVALDILESLFAGDDLARIRPALDDLRYAIASLPEPIDFVPDQAAATLGRRDPRHERFGDRRPDEAHAPVNADE